MARPDLKGGGSKGRSVVLVVSDDPGFAPLVRGSLSAVQDYELRETTAAAILKANGARAAGDVIILDVGSGALLEEDRILELRRELGTVPLIVVSDHLRPEHMRRLVQLNANDWLQQPLGGRTLLDAVAEQLQGSRIRKSDVYAFVPCTGGAGATSLAIAAAAHLSRRGGSSAVCLVDLDFASGACGRYLDTENEFNIESVIQAPERMDTELLGILKQDHPAGFALLSFRRPDLQIAEIGEAFVYRLLDIVTYRYPKVVLDLPSYPTPWTEGILANSDHVVLVMERTVPALKNAREIQQKLLAGGKAAGDLTLVVNKDRRKMFSVSIGAREIHRLFETKRTEVLPDAWPLMSEALNRGVPASGVNRRATLVKRLGRVLDGLSPAKRK